VITTKADSQKRVVLPQAKPGQLYAVHNNADGSFTLTAISPSPASRPTCRLANEDGFAVAVPDQPIDEEAIRELLADFP
jgi:molecular chaperone DnaK (HSP70)